MTNKIYIAIIALLVLGGGFFISRNQEVTQSPSGAISSPDIYSDYLNVNGLRLFYEGKGLNVGTTTVCAIKSPAATSTLVLGSVRFAVSSTTASTVHIARATSAFATTTNINTYYIDAGKQATIVASSTGSAATDTTIFPPSNYLVIGMQGGTGTFSPTGNCNAIFQAF